MFVASVSRKSFLKDGLEYGFLSCINITEFLESSLGVVLMYA